MRISLRGRLALWYALAIPVLIFALAFTAQQVMVVSLRASLDDTLEERTKTVAAAIMSRPGSNRESLADLIEQLTEERFPSIPLLLRIADSRGTVLSTFGDIPDPVVPSLERQLRQPNMQEGRFDSIKIRGVEALRVYAVSVLDPATQETLAIVQTGESLAQVTAAQNRLWRYTLLEGVVGSLLILGVGILILRRGFRPLDRILRRVREVESASLQVGLPEEPRPPELQQLANSLNTMWSRLDRAFRANRTFVANVSHDLRTPLTVLQGQIEVLLMDPSLSAEARDSLERMARETRRLIRMTNNLLLNALLESSPTLVAGSVNLRELLEEIISEVWVLAEDLDLNLTAPEEVVTPGDYDLLKQMVLNVVDNSIKFTPKGGRVELALATEEAWAVIEVSDSGPGIPSEHLARITEAFYKVRASRRADGGGAGLGLAIVKQIVELHGGRIEIRSHERVGTSVKMHLPRIATSQFEDASDVRAGSRHGA